MVKTRRKITALRVLQVLFYALGFPLFVHLVMVYAKPLAESNLATTGFGGNLSIIIACAMWLVVVLAQLLMRAVCGKNRVTRAIVVALVAAVVTLAPIVYCDLILKSKYEKELKAEQEKNENFWADTYEVQLTKKGDLISDTNWEIDEFLNTFNIEFNSKNFNMGGKNTDGSDVEYIAEGDVFLSPNGMYADGYRFSYYAAKDVLTKYYTNKYAFEEEGLDIDEELGKALAELNKPGSRWDRYKKGTLAEDDEFEYIDSSEEYALAYGPEGTARKYYLTPERLDAILAVVGENFGNNTALEGLLKTVKTLGGMLSGVLGEDIANVLNEVGSTLPTILNKNLNTDTLLEYVNGIKIGEKDLGTLLTGLLGEESAEGLTKDTLFDLLANFSFYQSPTAYPIYYFIEDDGLRDYAYANYYATVHGAKIGSVLVGDTVGKITMSAGGVSNPYSGHDLLNKFEKWDFDQKLQNEYYPFFIVRGIALKMSAAIVFVLLAAYFFTGCIDKQYAKLTLKQ